MSKLFIVKGFPDKMLVLRSFFILSFICSFTGAYATVNDTVFTENSAIKLYDYWLVSNSGSANDMAANIIRVNHFDNDSSLINFITYTSERVSEQDGIYGLANYYYQVGNTFFRKGKFFESIESFLRSKSIIEENNLQEMGVYSELCDKLGHIFYFFGDYEKARDFLLIWHKHPVKLSDKPQNVYNTMGLVYAGLMEYDSSNYYYNIGIDKAVTLDSKVWVGLISGNIAANYKQMGLLEKALELFYVDYEYSLESGNYISAANVQVSIARYNIDLENWEEVKRCLEEAKDLFIKANEKLPYTYYIVRSMYHASEGVCKQSLNDYQQAMRIKDEMQRDWDDARLKSVELRLFAEKKEAEISFLKEESERESRLVWFVIVTSIVVLLFLTVLIRQEQLKRRKDRSILEYKAKLANEELENARESINQLLRSINDKNRFIRDLSSEVEKLNEKNEDEELKQEKLELLEKLQDYTLLTEEDWIGFRKIFEKLHPRFFDTLLKNFPTLTNAEMRMACLIRLNLSNAEMASTLGISPDSVRKTNLRLRKKMEINSQDELIDYVFSIE